MIRLTCTKNFQIWSSAESATTTAAFASVQHDHGSHLYNANREARLLFVNRFFYVMHGTEIDATPILFSNKAWFHLSGHVNCQNNGFSYINSQRASMQMLGFCVVRCRLDQNYCDHSETCTVPIKPTPLFNKPVQQLTLQTILYSVQNALGDSIIDTDFGLILMLWMFW